MHGSNTEFGATLSSESNTQIQIIRNTNYEGPMNWIDGGSQIEVNSFEDIRLQPPGKAVLIGCPSLTYQENKCITNPRGLAYTKSGYITIGHTHVSQILLCPTFFRPGVLTSDNDFANQLQQTLLKNALKNIVEGGTVFKLDFGWPEAGA